MVEKPKLQKSEKNESFIRPLSFFAPTQILMIFKQKIAESYTNRDHSFDSFSVEFTFPTGETTERLVLERGIVGSFG